MLVYRFAADDLLRVRFAVHPLGELAWSILTLRDPAEHSVHAPWVRRARERLGDLDIAPLETLVGLGPTGYGVDFVAPPPRSPVADVDGELERVRATPPEQVAHELRLRFPAGVPPVLAGLVERPASAMAALVDLLAAYWSRVLAPDWPAVRDLAERDIAARAQRLTERGAGAVFDDLHDDVRWRDGALTVRRRLSMEIDLSGRGLLLVPAAFAWPRTFALLDEPWQPTIVYPPRGVGELWAPAADALGDPAALGALLGPRRARLLTALDRPASTTELASRLALAPSSVNEHLAVLRRAGLVHAWRDARHVRYARTETGTALVGAATGQLPRA